MMNRSAKETPAHAKAAAAPGDFRALASRFQKLLESERTRLARELHDDLTQKLTVLALELSLMEGSITSEGELPRGELRDKVHELAQLVNDMIQSLRKIKAELRPKVLDEFGLIAALEWESQEFQKRTGIVCRFRAEPDDLRVSAQTGTELFRMFQEILSNISAHARARRVEVEVRPDRKWLTLKVSDDGRGITRQELQSPGSVGLLELRERAASLGGELKINGAPDAGTSVIVKVPLAQERSEKAAK